MVTNLSFTKYLKIGNFQNIIHYLCRILITISAAIKYIHQFMFHHLLCICTICQNRNKKFGVNLLKRATNPFSLYPLIGSAE
jgi:hypothetical protein